MAKTTKLVGYGISFDMKLVGGTKTADDFTRVAKSVQKGLNSASNATKSFELAQDQLNQALKNGAISQKEYEDQLTRLRFRELKREEQLERQRRAVLGLDQQESILSKNRQRRARMAGMAAAGVSGLGMGGRAAGAARFLGGAAGLGGPAAALGLGFGAASVIKESISAFAELEAKVTALKSLFGEPLGQKLTVEFRNLAKTTILTNNQLIENAKTWASYGLTTDGLTDRLKRLGTVAGGNSEKFRSLTIAFAQVNAQGKLMGQEKNQLINAGFSLQAVADAAGISMENFADAMKDGEITAEHLNEALVKVTSEGGLFAGYLEKQAETITGKMTILSASWEEFLQALGESEKGPAGAFLDKMIAAANALKDAADYFGGKGIEPRAGQAQFLAGPFGGTKQAAEGRPEATLLGKAGGAALRDERFDEAARAARQAIMRSRGVSAREADRIYQERVKMMQENNKEDQRLFKENLEKEKQARKQLAEEDKKRIEAFESMLGADVTDQEISQKFEQTLGQIQTESIKKGFEKQFGMFGSEQMLEGPNMMEEMANEADAKKRKEDELMARKLENEIEFERTRAELLREEQDEAKIKFREREQQLAEELKKEKQMAQVPSVTGFEAGSVGEFQFLRKQTQESETAIAVDKAEKKAAAQRKQIADERKAQEQEFILEMRKISGSIETMNRQLQDTK
jgi:tape measure domain-containing protein